MYLCTKERLRLPVAIWAYSTTNKRIRMFLTRVKLRYLITEDISLRIVTIQFLVFCLTFEILFTKILDFFNMWIFVRTSMNLAHLATCSFQVIEFVDRPVPKTVDIFVHVCQTSENKAFFTKCSIL